MPPFTGWYLGADDHRRADRPAVPGRPPRHADDRDPGQRSARVRPLHAGRRTATSRRSTSRCCRRSTGEKVSHVGAFFDPKLFATFGLPARLPAGSEPGDPVPTEDRDRRPRRRRPRPGPRMNAALEGAVELLERSLGYTRVMLADVRSAQPRRADAVRRLGPAPPARPHGRRARRVHRGRRRAGSRSTRCRRPSDPVDSLRDKACALLGAWTAARPASRGGRRPASSTVPSSWRRRRWRSPCTAGTSPRRPVGVRRSPPTSRAACCRSRRRVWSGPRTGAHASLPQNRSHRQPSLRTCFWPSWAAGLVHSDGIPREPTSRRGIAS